MRFRGKLKVGVKQHDTIIICCIIVNPFRLLKLEQNTNSCLGFNWLIKQNIKFKFFKFKPNNIWSIFAVTSRLNSFFNTKKIGNFVFTCNVFFCYLSNNHLSGLRTECHAIGRTDWKETGVGSLVDWLWREVTCHGPLMTRQGPGALGRQIPNENSADLLRPDKVGVPP